MNFSKITAISLVLLHISGCATEQNNSTATEATVAVSKAERIQELQVVDCLLPGKVRQLGTTQYLTPRRPTRTTAADCQIRGGEYTAYDRATLKSSLEIWLPAAEAGDVEAMTNVGEIFERGLGDSPNYEAAALWYQRAAEAGNSRAQFNLGSLYEAGLGVAADKVAALNLYRQAWDMEEDDIIFQSVASTELESLRTELEASIAQQNSRISRLQEQLDTVNGTLMDAQGRSNADASTIASLEREVEDLELWIGALETERSAAQEQLAAAPRIRTPISIPSTTKSAPAGPGSAGDELDFGRYFALVIGNQDYSNIERLETPVNDATRIAEVLNERYGFSVQLLLNASNIEVMEAINDLNNRLGENDNLLIYYAGHGARIPTGTVESGYWLPVNADPPPRDTYWISNEFITGHLSRISAKRILVVADSCYAGLLSNSPGYLIVQGAPEYTDEFMRYKLPKRSRLLLSSGGDKPVLDEGDSGHSVFASVLLQTLEENKEVISGPQLYSAIDERIRARAERSGFSQRAEYKVIKGAGHEVGDFFFVPQ